MANPLLTDELWSHIKPLLPPVRSQPKGGRPFVPHRAALTGILFVLKTGLPWEYLPKEMGCGCGMTCWRRLYEWHKAGVWAALHQILLERLNAAGHLDWSRASHRRRRAHSYIVLRSTDPQTPKAVTDARPRRLPA